MDLSACRKVVIYGGSFDPPHMAHVTLPMAVMRELGADAVLYIPAGRAPHKRDRVQTAEHHRLAMLRLAVAGLSEAVVLTDEMDRVAATGQPSYTVDTLEALRLRLGEGVTMRLLIGADMAKIFQQWRSPERIVELAEPVVMVRPPDTLESLLEALPVGSREVWRSRVVVVAQMEMSSSDIRRRAAAGESLAGLVPAAVEEYIRRWGVYG